MTSTETGLIKGLTLGSADRPYRLHTWLGAGGMGEVWQAEDLTMSAGLGRPAWVALKVLPPELTRSDADRKMLIREAELARAIGHRNVVRVFDFGQDSHHAGRLFLVMEYLQGQDLDRLLADEGNPGLPLDRVLELLAPVATALDYVWTTHKIAHRDVKPGNIFLTKEVVEEKSGSVVVTKVKREVKLLDFGISARAQATSATVHITSVAARKTPGYAAPETAARVKPNPQLDIYSLAITVYRLLEGEMPFDDPRLPHAPTPEKPAALDDRQWAALQRGFAYDPKARYASATQFIEALRAAAAVKPASPVRGRAAVMTIATALIAGWLGWMIATPEPQSEPLSPRPSETPAPAPPAPAAPEEAKNVASSPGTALKRDCAECPELVLVPAGRFLRGSPPGEQDRDADEGPVREVRIARPFVVGKYEVTFEEWGRCVAEGGCSHRPDDRGWGRGKRPVINVSWNDAQEYLLWLNRKAGFQANDPRRYRLLSEAEWEYAARAGTTTRFYWGDDPRAQEIGGYAVYGGNSGGKTDPVGSKRPNAWGLHDMSGNAWEWVQDGYQDNYNGTPDDGSARTTGNDARRVVRGGSWGDNPLDVRSAVRHGASPEFRDNGLGFRLARTLE